MALERLHLVGGPGVGKTFLAGTLAIAHGFEHTELDKLYWTGNNFSKRQEPAVRDELLRQSLTPKRWVIEGSYYSPWIEPVLAAADAILLLRVSPSVQHNRLRQRNEKRLQSGTTDGEAAKKLMEWAEHHDECLTAFLKDTAKPYSDKIIELAGRSAVQNFVENVDIISTRET